MKDYKNKVAVITGAGSGIGKALALKCAQEGMRLVLADIEKEALKEVEKQIKALGAEVISLVIDVAKKEDMERLAARALGKFNRIHYFFNNAGVRAGTLLWKSKSEDWKWVFDVNVGSTVHAMQIFVPLMLNQEVPCHMICTASMDGLVPSAGNGIYSATKSAIISLCETLELELKYTKKQMKVSVVCPGFVNTQILSSERNRVEEKSTGFKEQSYSEQVSAIAGITKGEKKLIDNVNQAMTEGVATGNSPEKVAELIFRGMEAGQFYILTDEMPLEGIQKKAKRIIKENEIFKVKEEERMIAMNKAERKKLVQEAMEAKVEGAVYAVKNTQNGKVLVDATAELQGTINRFNFLKQMNDPFSMKMRADFMEMGRDAFVLEILETLEKKPEQTLEEFKEDLKLLKEIWIGKFDSSLLY